MRLGTEIGMANFTRQLGSVESLFATLHSMGAMLYVNIARIQGALSRDLLGSALELVQRRHPLLRAHLQESKEGFHFRAEGTRAIPLKVIARHHEEQWLELAESELLQPFTGELDPLAE